MTATLEKRDASRMQNESHPKSVRSVNGDEPRALNPRSRVVYVEGERIYFRPLESDDIPLVQRWINDPAVRRTLLHRPPLNQHREREWIESQGRNEQDYTFGLVRKEADRLIGCCGLHRVNPVNRSATLGISIGETSCHNRGFGTEAVRLLLRFGFEELNLNRIQLSVLANNPRGIRAYQKAGFVQEGCLRQAVYRDGRYEDEYRFAILREEWAGPE